MDETNYPRSSEKNSLLSASYSPEYKGAYCQIIAAHQEPKMYETHSIVERRAGLSNFWNQRVIGGSNGAYVTRQE